MNMMYASNNCYAEGQEASFGAPHYEVNVEKLAEVFGRQSVNAFSFLLDRVDTTTLSEFLTLFVNRERQAQMATATIIVRKTEKGIRRTGNTGLFQIFVQTSDGEVKLVHFTNQISTIYYLLHLIDRRQKQGELPPLHLGGNKDTFVELYHAVYDNISHDEVVRRFDGLIFRKEGNLLRAGRKNEVIYDIRRHLSTLFDTIGENFQPYAMTANSHLAISSERILFEGGAEDLLQLKCA